MCFRKAGIGGDGFPKVVFSLFVTRIAVGGCALVQLGTSRGLIRRRFRGFLLRENERR